MNKIIYISFVLCCIIFHSCNSTTNKTEEIQKFYINLNEETDDMKELCQNMDIRLTPMESMDTCIFNDEASKVKLVDDNIFIVDKSQDIIFRFDKKGRFKNLLSQKGQGDKEYKTMFSVACDNGSIYVQDHDRIQVYNYEGDFLKSIPHKRERDEVYVNNGQIYIRKNYTNEHQILILDKTNNLIAEYLPSHEVIRNFVIPMTNHDIMGSYKNGVYVANAMDNNIYLIKDTVSVLAQLDFGSMNLPLDFFEGNSELVEQRFNNLRSYQKKRETKAITMINNLVVTNEWITFTPESFDPTAVYCNRKTGASFINKGLKEPYATFFNGYKCPQGYDPKTKEFYLLVNSLELKEMIESLKDSEGNNYDKKYPFLKGINPEKIQDDSNAWILFFKMKV